MLKHISEFLAILAELENCESKEGLAEIKQRWKNHKMAFSELISTCKSANKRLDAAITAAELKVKEASHPQPQLASSSARKAATKAAGSAAAALWQACIEHCTACDEIQYSEDFKLAPDVAKGVDLSMPVKFHADVQEFAKKCPDLLSAATQLLKKFKLSTEYTTTKRSARKLLGDGLAQAKTVFKHVMPEQVVPPSEVAVSDAKCQ